MKYDKIRGNSIAEMMMQLRSQFGSSVYIIQTKEIRQGGLFGSDLLSRKQFEIEYMVSEGDSAGSRSRRPVSGALPQLAARTDRAGAGRAAIVTGARTAGLRPATAAVDSNLQDLDALIDSLKRLKDRGKTRSTGFHETEESSLQTVVDGRDATEPVVSARSGQALPGEPTERVAVRLPPLRSGAGAVSQAGDGPEGEDEAAGEAVRDFAAGLPTREELEALFATGLTTPLERAAPPSLVTQRSLERPPVATRSDQAGGRSPDGQQVQHGSHDPQGYHVRQWSAPPTSVEGEDALSRIHRRLIESQASPDFARRFMQRLERSLSEEDLQHPNRVRSRSLDKLKEMIRLAPTIEREHGERKVVFLVGPNGSGKTTSLAKLAAKYHIHDGAAVSVFSLDHYRLAATEQLKTYAAVLMVPFHAPVSPSEFLEFLDRDGSDYVFVDTSGLSLRDGERLEDLRRYIDCVSGPVEVHLVLSVSTSPSLTEKYMAFFDAVGFEKILLTRLDEADFLANFVEVADKWKRPFSFLMNGQTVPEHVLHVEPEELARMVLGLSG